MTTSYKGIFMGCRVRERGLRLGLLAALLLIAASGVLGQQVGAPAIAFDVVSIKPNVSDAFGGIWDDANRDGLMFRHMELEGLIYYAYDVKSGDQLVGYPAWTLLERFDVEAKVADADVDAFHKLSKLQRKIMLRPVLAERFKLKVHTELKEVAVYALVVGKRGSKLKEVRPEDRGEDGTKYPDGAMFSSAPGEALAKLRGVQLPMERLVQSLTSLTGKQVVDKTGLVGRYNFTLEWDHRLGANHEVLNAVDGAVGPSVFAAVEDQLGLKLEAQKVMVPVVVVDHVERPSEN